jgi:hypothetical protein
MVLECLNKDLELVYLGNGQYDRKCENDDFVLVEGLKSLETGITIKIMTIKGEMNPNITYYDFGDETWKYIKQKQSQLTQTAIKESIKKALEEIQRIKRVEYIEIQLNPVNPYKIQVSFLVTAINNEKITANHIMGVL